MGLITVNRAEIVQKIEKLLSDFHRKMDTDFEPVEADLRQYLDQMELPLHVKSELAEEIMKLVKLRNPDRAIRLIRTFKAPAFRRWVKFSAIVIVVVGLSYFVFRLSAWTDEILFFLN